MPSASARQLAPRHAEIFERSAIPAEFARQLGAFSVERRSDLPDDLAGYSAAYPGFVVPLRNLDGEVFHQVRLDNPAGGSKALQPEGSGSIITVHAPMADRVGVAGSILFVEGTRQTIAVMIHAPDEWLVVGLQGCQNWKFEGVPHPDLARLGVDGSEVVVLFDADLATNRDVNLAARQLGEHLMNLGAAKVRFATTPAGSKTGIDDYLGISFSSRADRSRAVMRIIESAADKAPRVPAARLKPPGRLSGEERTCVMSRGVTVIPGTDERPEKLVMAAAARLVEVTTILDPDDLERVIPAQLKVEVAIPSTEGITSFVVEVPDDRLADIGGLFNATRSGLALNLQRPTTAVAEREVANAIRACESDRTAHSLAFRRLGWILDDEGTWRYLHTKGALGPHDTREDLRAWMPPKSRCIGCIDPDQFDRAQIAAYVRMSIDNLDLLVDRTPWLALLGCAGVAPSGVIPNAAVGLVGSPSAGKTSILQTATAFLSPDLAYERKVMTTADATAASIDLALSGHDYSFVLLDDFHPEFDPREQARQVKALDAALRRAHGAPSKGRAQLANSVVEQASVNESHPVVLLSFEQLPAAAKSGLDRALTIEVTRSSTFRPGAFSEFAATGQSGALQVAYFGYLRYLAQRIATGPLELAEWLEWSNTERWPSDPESAMREWVLFVETTRDNFSRRVAERVPGATSRAHRVVGSLLVGLGLWLDYARTVGSVSDDEFEALSAEGFSGLVAAIDTHNEVALEGNLPAHEHILELIRSAVASGQAIVGQDGSPIGRAVRIGTFTDVQKGEYGPRIRALALDAHVHIPGCPPNWANALRPICLPEPSSGKPFRQIRVGGSRPRCAVIPIELTGIEEPNDERF
jgi:hypothetical protein